MSYIRHAIWMLLAILGLSSCSKPVAFKGPSVRMDGISRLEIYHVPFSMMASSAFTGDKIKASASYKITIFSPYGDERIDLFMRACESVKSVLPQGKTFEIRWRILAFNKDDQVTKTVDVAGSDPYAIIDGKSVDCGTDLFNWCRSLTIGMNSGRIPDLRTDKK